jgi:DNA-binding PadR family transcriptional regulator
MTKTRAGLTELEGAILGVLRRDPSATAYRIRQVFRVSRSAEWSGSAGAVYPALKRMLKDRLIAERPVEDERGTRTYALTPAGKAAHDAWLCDAARASGPGLDPFRTRAGFWSLLPPARQRTLMNALRSEIEKRRDALKSELPAYDEDDAAIATLHIALLDLRLKWIAQRRV